VDEALVRSVILASAVPRDARTSEGGGETQGGNAPPAIAQERPVNDNVLELPAQPPPTITADAVAGERLSREKRVLLSRAEEREVERLVQRMAEEFRSPVKLSHVLRACMAVLCNAENELLQRAKETGRLVRPANGDAVGLARFEHALAKVIGEALRDAPSLR